MKILLDTSSYSALLRGDERVARLIRRAESVVFSMVVVAELLAGFRHGRREMENRDRLAQLLADPSVDEMPITRATAEHFAAIWTELRSTGRPIPTNDIWIAAHARQAGAELVTFDAHFREVAGLLWIHLGGDS